MTTLDRLRRTPRWLGMLVILPLALLAATVLNKPSQDRLRDAREQLADAGYPEARVGRTQRVDNMHRCEVGQIRRRGYAYAWRNDDHEGLFCLRLDGRPNRIILDR